MNPSFKIIGLFFLFLIAPKTHFAHSPYEISYEIKANQTKPTLTLHLTPKTALDLVSYLKPALADQAVVKLDDYTEDYANYINKNLLLIADGQVAHFAFRQANLSQHDATLVFAIEQLPNTASDFAITANCFTHFYRKPQNIIQLQLPDGQQTFYLTSQNRHCKTSVKKVSAKTNTKYVFWSVGVLFFGSLVGYMLTIFQRKPSVLSSTI